MQLLYKNHFRTCCYYSRELKSKTLDIPALWHGDYFTGLRRLIVGGDASNSYCERCDYVKYFAEPMFLDIPQHVTGARRQNWERALEHHRNGVVDIDTFPIKYYMQFGLACNLRCVMCNHPQRYVDGESWELSADRMLEMSEYLKLAETVHVIGGEPLIIPNAVRFLDGVVANRDLWDLQYVIYTNALVLGDFIEKFLALERVVITASIDSSGESYDAIRRRSSWQKVTKNLERFTQVAREHNRREWAVYVSTILMKSSLLGLPDLLSWCIDHGFPTNIVNIVDLDGLRNDSEHIFRNPALLNDVPGWEAAITRSIAMLSNAGRKSEAVRLEQALSDLTQGLREQQTKRTRAAALGAEDKWETLFAAADQELIDGLHKHSYGRRREENRLERGPDGIRFTPASMKDHLTTPFVECATARPLWIRVTHEWVEPTADVHPASCVVILQDGLNLELEVDREEVSRGAGLVVTQYVRLPAKTEKIRLHLMLRNKEAGRLPDRLRLEQLRQPPLVSTDGALRLVEVS
jgi:uncharacterized Fe-S cluster-containing radical SAM superfamily protein